MDAHLVMRQAPTIVVIPPKLLLPSHTVSHLIAGIPLPLRYC